MTRRRRAAGADLVVVPTSETRQVDSIDDRPEVGSWWWVSESDDGDVPSIRDLADDGDGDDPDDDAGDAQSSGTRYDRPGRQWLGCVTRLGSNYAQLEGVRLELRVALDDFHARCQAEPAPEAFIAARVGRHRRRVRALMREIQGVCARLGVPMRQALAGPDQAQESSHALAVAHGVADVEAHRDALVRAREETLPALFARVKKQHEEMARWMRAELIPAQAELAAAEQVTETISGKIHVVELYAGLQETLVQVREGSPAGVDDRVHLMQRRHYMDEECLARYEAGGMDFEDVEDFDRWLSRDENFRRILPHSRCVVAFRIRRHDKRYEIDGLAAFIRFWHANKKNQQTFLYVRNGDQLWRMETSIEFGEELFPRQEDAGLVGDDELWVDQDDVDGVLGIVSGRQLADMVAYHRAKRQFRARRLWQWHRAGKPEDRWEYVAQDGDSEHWSNFTTGSVHLQSGEPWEGSHDLDHWPDRKYRRLTPESIYYDDAMARIQRATLEHNRVAVVVQGLLDRSTCLHPHPPWRIWTPEGFASGVELVYDVSRVVTPGTAPDFEVYRQQLNRSLRSGCHTIGQQVAWREAMEEQHGDRWRSHVPGGIGNPGPGKVHRVERVRRDQSCEFKWNRDRNRPKWVTDPENRRFLKATYPPIPTGWTCPAEHLTCVDAYTPGDFHLFYDDPRTRADYLQWAPILLACEDWHHARKNQPDPSVDGGGDDGGDDDGGGDATAGVDDGRIELTAREVADGLVQEAIGDDD